jgi:Diacylglycerol kinase catalytic domain
MTDTSSWPTATAESTKLFIPPEYGVGNREHIQCTLRYDPILQAIHVVLVNSDSDCIVEEEETILDSFYAFDIVGADVEIKLLGSAADTPPRSTTSAIRPRIFSNKSPPTISAPAEKETGNGGCGIFKPLTEDMDKIFSTCDNEPLSDLPFDAQATAVLSIYVYPRQDPSLMSPFQTWCGMGNNNAAARKLNRQLQITSMEKQQQLGHRYAHHRRFEVAPSEDFANLSELVRAIRKVSRPTTTTPTTGTSQQEVMLEPQQQRMLVVINPVSGPKKNGLAVFETIVSPMLEQAGISHDVLLTTHPNHAGERAACVVTTSTPTKGKSKRAGRTDEGGDQDTVVEAVIDDISAYTAIVTIGGDGVVHEVLQGIHARPDADQILKKLQFGIIPAGSANGMAASLAGWSKVRGSVFSQVGF